MNVIIVMCVLVEEGVLVVMCVNRGDQTRSGSTPVVGWVLVGNGSHTHNVTAMAVVVEVDGVQLGMVVW